MALIGATSIERIINFLRSKGLNDFGIAGVLGNLFAESGLNPRNLQNTYEKKFGMTDQQYTDAVDNGTYANFVHDKAGYGLCQWTYWSRKQNLLNFAKTRKVSIGDEEMQLEFFYKELSTSYPAVLSVLKTATSVLEASNVMLLNYERPADQSKTVQNKRFNYSQNYFNNFLILDDKNGDDTLTAVNKLIETARKEKGYLEKASNSQLDSKTANPGKNNWTKYARDLDKIGNIYNGKKNGYSWCDIFVDWCFIVTFGVDLAMKLLCQSYNGLGAGCTYSAQYYINKGQFYKTPHVGDQIFFTNNGGKTSCHTGIVIGVDNKKVYTIEGNTSSSTGVVDNGGSVQEKSYSLSYSCIYGYGRPDWSLIESVNEQGGNDMDKAQFKKLWFEIWQEMRKDLQDNDAGAYSKDARAWAINNGIIQGNGTDAKGNPNYMWEDILSRQQMVTILYRFAQLMGKV